MLNYQTTHFKKMEKNNRNNFQLRNALYLESALPVDMGANLSLKGNGLLHCTQLELC